MEVYLGDREKLLRAHGIEWGYLVFAVSLRTTLIEPLFYWPDQRTAYHERMIEPHHLAKLPRFAPDPGATAAVSALREDLIRLFSELGCAHLQIGKACPYLETRQPRAAALLQSLKDAVDPQRLINPGALGLA